MLAVASLGLTGRWRPLARQLQDPVGLVSGLLLGAVLYHFALALVQARPLSLTGYGAALRRSLGTRRLRPARVAVLGARAVYEEAFWRGTLQFVLGNSVPGVAVTAALFTLRHLYLEWIGQRSPSRRRVLEFAIFSLILGATYVLTDRILVVVGMHWARNLLIDVRLVPDPARSGGAAEARR